MAFEAKIIADSRTGGRLNPNGSRLTTMQLTHPRIIHAEFMTHGMFARNASSSRAIPFSKTVERVMKDPFIPTYWGVNQKGMQAFVELQGKKREIAIRKWLEARDHAVKVARELANDGKCKTCDGDGYTAEWRYKDNVLHPVNPTCPDCDGDGIGLNVHKQIVNRLIEPWSWITVCVTGDEGAWANYFCLRCHKDAAHDIQRQAFMAQRLYCKSTPQLIPEQGWHTPYVSNIEYNEIVQTLGFDALKKVSVGRCARTSYLTQEGTRDYLKDIELHDRLCAQVPKHMSPFEHVCEAMADTTRYAKYIGWRAYRHTVPQEYLTTFVPNWEEYFKHVEVEG